MKNPPAYPKYYNTAGKYTESERDFLRCLERELTFYRRLHKQAVKKGTYGIKINPGKTNKIFRLSDF